MTEALHNNNCMTSVLQWLAVCMYIYIAILTCAHIWSKTLSET